MIMLFLGMLLWWLAHLFKRVAPAQRGALQAKMGDGSKGVVAAALFASVLLMYFGYTSWYSDLVYTPPGWGIHLNNLLMLIAVALYGVGNSKSRLRAKMRHPMLIGTIVWAVAHLLVNGDAASLVLFGGIGLWAAVEIVTINRAVPDWQPWQGGSAAGDMRLAGITVAVFVVFALIHWLVFGYWPFPQ